MKFLLSISPDDLGRLPAHLQDQVGRQLGRKVHREAMALQNERAWLEQRERELKVWDKMARDFLAGQ